MRNWIFVVLIGLSSCAPKPPLEPVVVRHDILLGGVLQYLRDCQDLKYMPTPEELKDARKELDDRPKL